MRYKQPKEATTELAYSRSGAATAWRKDGTLQEFAPKVIRRTDAGMTFEGPRTNLFLRWDPTIEQISTKGGDVSNVQPPANAPLTGRNWVGLGAGTSSTPAYMYAQCSAIAASTVVTLSFLCETPDGTAPVYGSGSGADFDVGFVNGRALTSPTFSVVRRTGNIWECRLSGVTPYMAPSVFAGPRRSVTSQNQRPLKFSGFQLELGTRASTPIITTGAAATVGADNLAFLRTAAEGEDFTIITHVSIPADTTSSLRFFEWDTGDSNNRILIQRSATGTLQMTSFIGGASQTVSAPSFAGAINIKVALKRSGLVYEMIVGGVKHRLDVSIAVGFSRLFIGSGAGSNAPINGQMHSINVFPYALTDEELVRLTSLDDTTFDHLSPGGVYYYDPGQTATPRKSQVVAPISSGRELIL